MNPRITQISTAPNGQDRRTLKDFPAAKTRHKKRRHAIHRAGFNSELSAPSG